MRNSVDNKAMNLPKEVYVKPAMEVVEIEVEEGILDGFASGSNDGGTYPEEEQVQSGDAFWDKYNW